MLRAVVCPVLVAVTVVACGKSKDPASVEPKLAASALPATGVPAHTTIKPAVATAMAPAEPSLAASPVKPAPRGPERAVYSLVDNRLSAHLGRGGGLVVPAGSAGFAKYTRFGNLMKGSKRSWALRQTQGEIKVARLTGKTGTVFVPLTAAQAGRSQLRLRVFAARETTLSLRVNGSNDLQTSLAEGWSTVDVAVPAGQLKDGENALQLFTKSSGLALAWLQVGAATPVGDDGATTFYDPGGKALVVPQGGQMTWYVAIPEQTRLIGDLADPRCAITVRATGEDGSKLEGTLAGAGSAVDLAALGGKAARLELEATGCASAALTNAALVVPGQLALRRGPPPKHVVFIIMDSLRADRVRTFNPRARAETPNFDKLAETGALFTANYVQGNESQVSHASMWTASYPAKHKAMAMKDHLPDRWLTIDEVAKKAGMFVAGASGNGYIRPTRGFGSGWDKYINHITEGGGLKGVDLIDRGLSFIANRKTKPWFLYLGLIDTHVTWRAKQPWIERYDPGYKGRFATQLGDSGPGGFPKDMTEREKEHVRALYDSNVSYQDDQLGKLIDKFKAWGIWDQTMVIITADHGDELWEHGRAGHGGTQRETLINVPLVVHYPPLIPPARITAGTDGIDIVPTLADALGVAFDPEWQGASLIPLAHSPGGYPLIAFSSQYENAHAGRSGHWKLQLSGTQAPRLYHLARDPNERNDLWDKPGSQIAGRLLLDPMWLLRSWNAEWKKSAWGNPAAVTSRFAADLGE